MHNCLTLHIYPLGILMPNLKFVSWNIWDISSQTWLKSQSFHRITSRHVYYMKLIYYLQNNTKIKSLQYNQHYSTRYNSRRRLVSTLSCKNIPLIHVEYQQPPESCYIIINGSPYNNNIKILNVYGTKQWLLFL